MVATALFVHPNADGSGTSPASGRASLAGLVAPGASGAVRTGVLSGCVVTGASGWSYAVAAGTVVAEAGAAEAMLFAVPASSAATSPSPGTGSRVDVVYALHTRRLEGDASSEVTVGVAVGVSSTSTPTVPTVPAGAVVLGVFTVPSGTTGTSGATADPLQVQHTAVRGAPIPVAGTAQRNAITWGSVATPARVWRRDTGVVEINTGSGWTIEGVLPSRKSAFSGTLAIASSTTTPGYVNFNSIPWNNGISYSGGTQEFTFPVAGRYRVTMILTVDASGTGNRFAILSLNGVQNILQLAPGTASQSTILNASDEVEVAAGDVMKVGLRQNSGGALNLTAATVVIRCVERL